MFAIYIAPSESNADFHKTLDELGIAVRAVGGGCVITSDFNAKSVYGVVRVPIDRIWP